MADLGQWWQGRDESQQQALLALEEGDRVPPELAGSIVGSGLAVGTRWEGQQGYTFTVNSALGTFLDQKRAAGGGDQPPSNQEGEATI